MKYTFPTQYGTSCVLIPIDTALIPLVSGALRHFETRSTWATPEDYELGYNAFSELQASMTTNCVAELTKSIDRLYRLLDTSLNGTQYLAAFNPTTGENLVLPEIPDVPPASTSAPNAMRAHLGRLYMLGENSVNGETFPAGAGINGSAALDDDLSVRETIRALQGIINAGWFGIGGQNATLADVVTALRLGGEGQEERVNTALDAIVGASSGATIFNTLRSLFTDSADLTMEGAQFIVTMTSAMAQIMSNELLSNQLERVIQTLGGAGLLPPEDTILQALRGDTPASATRNVIDSAGAGELPDLAEIAADVEEIRQKVQ